MQGKQHLITILAGTTGWTFNESGTTMIQFEFDTFGILLRKRGEQCEIFALGDIFQMDESDIEYV